MKKKNRRQPKRGIVLLVVLSLLALFALLVVTFVVVAGAHRQVAVNLSRHGRYNEEYSRLADIAM